MTDRILTEAQIARAVAHGAQDAKRKEELRKSMIGVCALLVIVLLFVFEGLVARVLPGNEVASNVAAITAIVLPWVVFWKALF